MVRGVRQRGHILVATAGKFLNSPLGKGKAKGISNDILVSLVIGQRKTSTRLAWFSLHIGGCATGLLLGIIS